MGYDDSNNVFMKNLGIFLTIYCTLCTKLILREGFFTNLPRWPSVRRCGGGGGASSLSCYVSSDWILIHLDSSYAYLLVAR